MSIDIQAFARLFVDSLMIGSEESVKDECFRRLYDTAEHLPLFR